jgi:hypothetical protein
MGALVATGSGWSTWTPGVSVVVALLALLIAASNRSMAKRALALSQQQEERRQAKLDLSLKDAVSYRDATRGSRWIGVEVLAVNPTDRDGAIIAADLHVTYRSNGRQLLLKVPHQSRSSPFGAARLAIEVPAGLPANGAIDGWLLFRIDDGVVQGAIDRYDIVVSDSRGPVEVLQTWAMTEVSDATPPTD